MHPKTISVAESCTGGLLGSLITDKPGCSDYFIGGVICYSNDIKVRVLRVPKKGLDKHGAVSEYTARHMAKNVRKLFRADIGVGITGIAGPDGGSEKKPVGLVYIARADSKGVICKKFNFSDNRTKIKSQAACAALKLIPFYA